MSYRVCAHVKFRNTHSPRTLSLRIFLLCIPANTFPQTHAHRKNQKCYADNEPGDKKYPPKIEIYIGAIYSDGSNAVDLTRVVFDTYISDYDDDTWIFYLDEDRSWGGCDDNGDNCEYGTFKFEPIDDADSGFVW